MQAAPQATNHVPRLPASYMAHIRPKIAHLVLRTSPLLSNTAIGERAPLVFRKPHLTSYCCTSLLFSAASMGMIRPRLVDTPCLYATWVVGKL